MKTTQWACVANARYLTAVFMAFLWSLTACGGGSMSSGGRTFEPPVTPPPPTAPSTEYRAIWVDAFHPGIKTQAQVDKLVADAQKGHINAIFAQVRKRGDSYYNVSL